MAVVQRQSARVLDHDERYAPGARGECQPLGGLPEGAGVHGHERHGPGVGFGIARRLAGIEPDDGGSMGRWQAHARVCQKCQTAVRAPQSPAPSRASGQSGQRAQPSGVGSRRSADKAGAAVELEARHVEVGRRNPLQERTYRHTRARHGLHCPSRSGVRGGLWR